MKKEEKGGQGRNDMEEEVTDMMGKKVKWRGNEGRNETGNRRGL